MQQCPICFSLIQHRGEINCCRHSFCFECISQWAKIQNTCPICKKRFNKISKFLPTVSQRERVDQNLPLYSFANQQPNPTTSFSPQSINLTDHSQGDKQLGPEARMMNFFLVLATQNFNIMLDMSKRLQSFQKNIQERIERHKQKRLRRLKK